MACTCLYDVARGMVDTAAVEVAVLSRTTVVQWRQWFGGKQSARLDGWLGVAKAGQDSDAKRMRVGGAGCTQKSDGGPLQPVNRGSS